VKELFLNSRKYIQPSHSHLSGYFRQLFAPSRAISFPVQAESSLLSQSWDIPSPKMFTLRDEAPPFPIPTFSKPSPLWFSLNDHFLEENSFPHSTPTPPFLSLCGDSVKVFPSPPRGNHPRQRYFKGEGPPFESLPLPLTPPSWFFSLFKVKA